MWKHCEICKLPLGWLRYIFCLSNASYNTKKEKLEFHLWIDYNITITNTACSPLEKKNQLHLNFISLQNRFPYPIFKCSQFKTIWPEVSVFQVRTKMWEKALIFLTLTVLLICFVPNKTSIFGVSLRSRNTKQIQSQTSIHDKKCNLETIHYEINRCVNETKMKNVILL